MSGYRDLEIYRKAYGLAIKVHPESLKLPQFELYEQGSQVRRSSKSIKDNIVEGYGRRRYKAEYIKFLTYSLASCDESINHLLTIIDLYPDSKVFMDFLPEYEKLGKMINNYIQYVESHWNS
ncbi:MAG TPA: four helix bundle protein [Bacteroidales bacterium]|nr:four helix bundle protein [Bacteroidales bacterium]